MSRLSIIGYAVLLCLVLAACGQTAAPASTAVSTSLPPTSAATAPAAAAATSQPQPTAASTPPFITTIAISHTLRGTIAIDGSSTVFPITEAAGQAFNAVAPEVRVQLGVSGTSSGFKKFCEGETSISDASRPIKQSEIEACRKNGIAFIELPIAFDGLSVVVHPQNTWASCMTVAELKKLWEPAAQGQITRWSQIRSGWPDLPIALYGAGTDSGTFDYFTSAIVGQEDASRSDYTASEDDYVLAQNVAADPHGLGYFGYAYYREYQDRLKIVAIDSGSGCVEPNEQTITEARYQPLSRPLFLYIHASSLDRPEFHAFVTFYLQNVALFVRDVNYIPLPENVSALVQKRFQQRRLDSVFSGTSQVNLSIERLLLLEQ